MPVHPTAILHDGARLSDDVEVGPYAVIGPHVTLGARCRVDSHALVTGRTTIGDDCHVHHGAAVGSIPQDLKFKGEETRLTIGPKTVIREFVTISVGTAAVGETVIGSNCLLMVYSHVAHDCVVGDNVIMGNCAALAGHVKVCDWAVIGALSAVHQFARVGRLAYIGGASRVPMDVIPFSLSAGNPLRVSGLNLVGLKRQDFPADVIDSLKKAYRIIFRSNLILKDALKKIEDEIPGVPEVAELSGFVATSERGFHR